MTQRTMHSYPVEDGTIELLVHKGGKTYGLRIYTAEYSSQKDILSQLRRMCLLAMEVR